MEVATTDSEFLTFREAAVALKISVPTLRSAVMRGQLPVVKLGRRVRRIPAQALRGLAVTPRARRRTRRG